MEHLHRRKFGQPQTFCMLPSLRTEQEMQRDSILVFHKHMVGYHSTSYIKRTCTLQGKLVRSIPNIVSNFRCIFLFLFGRFSLSIENDHRYFLNIVHFVLVSSLIAD